MQRGLAYPRVFAKFNWANKHVKNFEAAWEKFRISNPHTVVREVDEQAGEVSFRVTDVRPVPEEFPFLVGDALQNLRSTLDYLACELVAVAGNLPNSQTAFPIFDTPDEYWERLARKVKGMRQQTIEAINRLQPYQGGYGDTLWQLHRLNNVDKHRIVLTMVLANVGRTMTPSEMQRFRARHETVHGPGSSRNLRWAFTNSSNARIPLEAGDVLWRGPASEAHENMSFPIDIAFDEPPAAEGVPVVLLLNLIQSEVSRLITDMGPHLM